MDYQSPGLDFAFIGHQDSWERIGHWVNRMGRVESLPELGLEKIREIYPYIPPRALFEIEFYSFGSQKVRGVYIETFIPPETSNVMTVFTQRQRVKEACQLAARLGAPIVALGGLTSILLETSGSAFSKLGNSFFTSGNTLTAAFIVDGIESACMASGLPLSDAELLIIGSTGDIGSAAVGYFTGKVKRLLLHARRLEPLAVQAAALQASGQATHFSTALDQLLPEADIILSVASSEISNKYTSYIPDGAMIFDAGYPKNLDAALAASGKHAFSAGLGIVSNGFESIPGFYKEFYTLPEKDAAHGCLLEAVVLALEKKCMAFSRGRGNIRLESMSEIRTMAAKHGIRAAAKVESWPMADYR
jgi:fatty aldehyde-generating acyl-ACP reductase